MGLGHLVQTPIINILVQFLSTFFVLLQYQIHAVLFRTMHVSEQHRIQWQNPYQSLYWPFQEASSSLKTSFDILIFSVFKVASRLRESRLISWGLMHLFGEAKSSINLSKISSTSYYVASWMTKSYKKSIDVVFWWINIWLIYLISNSLCFLELATEFTILMVR